VLTIRELAKLLKQHPLNLSDLPFDQPDSLFGERSAVVKCSAPTVELWELLYAPPIIMITGGDVADLDFKEALGLKGMKE
jgi:hypothetical protein